MMGGKMGERRPAASALRKLRFMTLREQPDRSSHRLGCVSAAAGNEPVAVVERVGAIDPFQSFVSSRADIALDDLCLVIWTTYGRGG